MIFRRKYRKPNGEIEQSRYWSVRFTGPDGQLIRRSTKITSKTAAAALERKMVLELEAGKAGIIDPSHSKTAFEKHAKDYADHLEALGRDPMYVYTMQRRLVRLGKEAGWRHLGDVTLASFEKWRASLEDYQFRGQTITPRTANQYLDSAKQFCEWARKAGRMRRNPLEDAEHARALARPNYRRAATVEELTKLLAAVTLERKRFYLFAIYCPLRRSALAGLRWDDLHLDDTPAWGLLRPEINKTRTPERFPLRVEVVTELKKVKVKTGRLFKEVPTADDLRADLEKAKVPFSDKDGNRRLDLHAFRKTAIELLRQAGVPLREAKEILHHKDERTTAKYYGERPDPVTIAAVEKMPRFS